MQGQSIGKKIAYMGVLTALAILLGYLESLLPINFGIPGIKIGLSNLVVVAALYLFSWKEAVVISVVRVAVVGLLFGNIFGIAYGMAGALLSLIVMALLKAAGCFGVIGISAAGGAMHGVGQIAVAFLVTPALPLLWYMPVLMITGTATGILIGFAVFLILRRLPKNIGVLVKQEAAKPRHGK